MLPNATALRACTWPCVTQHQKERPNVPQGSHLMLRGESHAQNW